MQAIYNLTNPHAANGRSYSDTYLNNRTVYFDFTGTALEKPTINSVRFVWYGNSLGAGTGTVAMNGGSMTLPFGYTGEARQECVVVASGATAACFTAGSGTLSVAVALTSGYIRFQWARLEVDYTPSLSSLTLSSGTVEAGQSVTATIGTHDAGYTHKLDVTLGAYSQQYTLAAGVTSQEVTIPMSILEQMPNSKLSVAAVKLTTLNGESVIGSVSQNLTVMAGASSAPMFTGTCNPLFTVDGVTYPDVTGGYVQNKSGVTASMNNVTAQYGASIVSTSITVGTYSMTGTGDISLTSGLLNQSGSMDVTLTATDSRGVSRVQTVTIDVEAYNPPRLNVLSVKRCDADGTVDAMGEYGSYNVSWTHSDLSGKNACTASLSVRPKGSTDTPVPMASDATSGQSGVLSDDSGAYALNQAYSWEVILTLTDGYGSVNFASTIGSAQFVRTVNRGLNAVAYGKVAEHQDSFEVAKGLEMYVYGQTLPNYVKSFIPSVPAVSYTEYPAAVFNHQASSYSTLVELTAQETGLYIVQFNVRMNQSVTSRTFVQVGNCRVSFPENVSYPSAFVSDVLKLDAGAATNLLFYSDAGGYYQYEKIVLTLVKLA